MMFYDVLSLKRILGFLLSERTSGVSPVIFSLEVGPWAEVLPRSSPRLDSRLDVRRNQVLNLVNVSLNKLIPKVLSNIAFYISMFGYLEQ